MCGGGELRAGVVGDVFRKGKTDKRRTAYGTAGGRFSADCIYHVGSFFPATGIVYNTYGGRTLGHCFSFVWRLLLLQTPVHVASTSSRVEGGGGAREKIEVSLSVALPAKCDLTLAPGLPRTKGFARYAAGRLLLLQAARPTPVVQSTEYVEKERVMWPTK